MAHGKSLMVSTGYAHHSVVSEGAQRQQSYAQAGHGWFGARTKCRCRLAAAGPPEILPMGGGRADAKGPWKRNLRAQFLFFLCYNRATIFAL